MTVLDEALSLLSDDDLAEISRRGADLRQRASDKWALVYGAVGLVADQALLSRKAR